MGSAGFRTGLAPYKPSRRHHKNHLEKIELALIFRFPNCWNFARNYDFETYRSGGELYDSKRRGALGWRPTHGTSTGASEGRKEDPFSGSSWDCKLATSPFKTLWVAPCRIVLRTLRINAFSLAPRGAFLRNVLP